MNKKSSNVNMLFAAIITLGVYVTASVLSHIELKSSI